MFKNKYRVVVDNYLGYEAQVKYWWCPFWIQLSGRWHPCNTCYSVDEARILIEKHKVRNIPVYQE